MLNEWSRQLKTEALTVWYISKSPETPWYTRVFAVLLVAYAFSPIDLIPDFIPVLGYLDDLVILPVGAFILLWLTPPHIVIECRAKARDHVAGQRAQPISRMGVVLTIVGWAVVIVLMAILLRHMARTAR